jgi:hypothetical protein
MSPLGLLPKCDPAILEKLQLVEQYDLGFLVPRLVPKKTNGLVRPSEADALIRDLRRFLVLPILFPGETFCPSKKLDEAWHAFILNTRSYREFCGQVFGRYRDHDPDLPGQPVDHARYPRTLSRYRQAFGPPSPLVWGTRSAPRPHPTFLLVGCVVSLTVFGAVVIRARRAK